MYNLTTPQQNIWNLQAYYEGSSISNLCGAVFFHQKLDTSLLTEALNYLIKSQEGLRLRFSVQDGTPMQYVAEYVPVHFNCKSFVSREEYDAFVSSFALTPFMMENSTMYRFVIFEIAGETGVLMCINHLIADAWSISLITDIVTEKYYELSGEKEGTVPVYSYLDYVQSEQDYLQSRRFQNDTAYWSDLYSEKPELSEIKPNSAPIKVPASARYFASVPADLTAKINSFAEKNEITQAVQFEAAIVGYLAQVNPEKKSVTFGMPVLNRTTRREKQTVGMFISTLPLTISVAPETTALELCQQITDTHMGVFRHQKYPYSEIIGDLRKRFNHSGNLYDVMISYQNAQIHSNMDITSEWYCNGYSEVPIQFHIDNRDGTDHYTLNIDYQTELFKAEEVSLLVQRILYIMEQMLSNPEMRVGEVSVLPDEERRKVIFDFNDTAEEYPRDKCVHELFMEQAAKTPDKFALVFEEKQFTYQQLDEMSNSLAHFLRRKGIEPGSIVPIISKRSWHVIVAMLGILKAGGAYMPVDPTYPKDRIDYMFETARCSLALTYGYSEALDVETVSLESFDFQAETTPVDNLNSSEDLCYIIFTSGSTGKPKGVSLCHRNVVNYSDNNNNNVCHRIIEANNQSIVSVTNIIFDIFVTESLLPLLNGICIYFANDEQVFSQKKLAELISYNSIDVMQTTPTKMRSYIMDKQNVTYLQKLRAIVLGGEALPADLYLELRSYTDARIFNIYGPAETTVWSTNKCVEDTSITIGKPIANTQIYILDANRKPLPIGVAGELCISGDGVGKGYLNRPELTAERFIPNPFLPGKTMYCTGDLARWRADGEIEYLGRMDTQVKIRGLRIELGEIESVMSGFEGIQLAAVTDKRDETGRQYLVGYYTTETEIDEKELRRYLSAKLPKYMVPNYFVHLPEMPMTASGKTDRKNLPLPEFSSIVRECIAPKSDMEKSLCELLEKLLSYSPIGVTDDFFELGGDSLKAIEYVAKAHNIGIDFSLQKVFDYPTVRLLCDHMLSGASDRVVYSATDFEKYQPLLDRNVIDDSFIPEYHSLGNVLLTGATGFLGAHILEQLVMSEAGKVYCLVRGGEKHLFEVLSYYFGDSLLSELGNRIIAIEGDITHPELADQMPENIQTVIHAAATVKHFGAYSYFDKINVDGTRNVIAYATRVNAKLIHTSTISVSGNSMAEEFDGYRSEDEKFFDETSLYIGQPLDNVYGRSKFEAERVVLDAELNGLDAIIVRMGNLTNRSRDLKFQSNYTENAFLKRIKAGLEMGMLPENLMEQYMEFTPIDQAAECVVRIAQYAAGQNVFHVNSNKGLYFDHFFDYAQQLGLNIAVVPAADFNVALQRLSQNTRTEYIYEAFQNDLDKYGNLTYDSNIHIVNDFTIWFMKQIGLEWADVDLGYIRGYVEYFRELGYFNL